MKLLIVRNLKLYFRDRLSVFFSMMSVFIMLGLYICFLSDVITSGALDTLENGNHILNVWLLAGLLAIASVTTTFAAYGVMVSDRSKGIVKDFYASSVPRWKLYLSYIIASWIIGLLMSLLTLFVGDLYLIATGGDMLTLSEILSVCGVMLISVGTGCSMMFFLACFLNTESAFSNASILLGTLIGFLMGIYIPIGGLPEFAQSVVRFFPMSQACVAYRQVLVHEPLQLALKNAPADLLPAIEEQLGIAFTYGDVTLTLLQSILLLGVSMIFFYVVSIAYLRLKKTK